MDLGGCVGGLGRKKSVEGGHDLTDAKAFCLLMQAFPVNTVATLGRDLRRKLCVSTSTTILSDQLLTVPQYFINSYANTVSSQNF